MLCSAILSGTSDNQRNSTALHAFMTYDNFFFSLTHFSSNFIVKKLFYSLIFAERFVSVGGVDQKERQGARTGEVQSATVFTELTAGNFEILAESFLLTMNLGIRFNL